MVPLMGGTLPTEVSYLGILQNNPCLIDNLLINFLKIGLGNLYLITKKEHKASALV